MINDSTKVNQHNAAITDMIMAAVCRLCSYTMTGQWGSQGSPMFSAGPVSVSQWCQYWQETQTQTLIAYIVPLAGVDRCL